MRTRIRRALLGRATSKGIDLSQLSRVPDSLSWPLRRDGLDPVARLTEQEPVSRLTNFLGMNVWLVTGEVETRHVLADTTSYSNDIRPFVGARGSTTDGDIGGLGFTDPPEHTKLRKLLTPEFTMRRLERLRPRIADIVERQLDVVEAGGPVVDLVSTFAFPVPFLVICELLGLPVEDRERFRELGNARFDVTYGGTGSLGAVSQSRMFLMESTRKQRSEPGEGLIGQIIREHGDEISDFDLAGLADGVFTGGLETTASMLALGTAVLLRDPDGFARLGDDETRVEPVVEELLRYLSVVQIAFPRFAREDLDLFGNRVRAGDVVICSLAGADRDARSGQRMHEFDPARPPHPHYAFGHGFHRCVGAELARMELRMAYPAMARRFPRMQLAAGADELALRQLSIVFGVDELPVDVRQAATVS
ncbi:MAG TPA: cytochrome P450 [Nocardioidaceae bacterium]|nr:cytochrome P450 [Nocardioidaceae bacterium]